jgi:hypothetical protein
MFPRLRDEGDGGGDARVPRLERLGPRAAVSGSASRSALIGCHSFAVSSESPSRASTASSSLPTSCARAIASSRLRGRGLVAHGLPDGGGAGVGEGVDQLQRRQRRSRPRRPPWPRRRPARAAGRGTPGRRTRRRRRAASPTSRNFCQTRRESDQRHARRDDRSGGNGDDVPGGVQGRRGTHGTGYRPGANVTLVAFSARSARVPDRPAQPGRVQQSRRG